MLFLNDGNAVANISYIKFYLLLFLSSFSRYTSNSRRFVYYISNQENITGVKGKVNKDTVVAVVQSSYLSHCLTNGDRHSFLPSRAFDTEELIPAKLYHRSSSFYEDIRKNSDN